MEIFSRDLEDSQLLLNGLGFEPCSSVKLNPIAVSFCENAGQKSQTSETSGQLTFWNGAEESTFCQAASLASHSVAPDGAEARRMTETSGRQCALLSSKSGLFGLFVKTCLESSLWGNSSEFVWIWNTSVTRHNRLLFQLTPLGQSTDGSGSSFWPTPTERDWKSTSHGNQDNARPLSEVAGLTSDSPGSLNPRFVEELMGFPIDHTALKR